MTILRLKFNMAVSVCEGKAKVFLSEGPRGSDALLFELHLNGTGSENVATCGSPRVEQVRDLHKIVLRKPVLTPFLASLALEGLFLRIARILP